MVDLSAPWLSICILAMIAAAFVARLKTFEIHQRSVTLAGCSISFLCALETVREVAGSGWKTLHEPVGIVIFRADALNAVTMALFLFVVLVSIVSAPRRDINSSTGFALLMLSAGTLTAYAADNLTVFLAGWVVALLPAWRTSMFESITGSVLLAGGALLQAAGSSRAAFVCLACAAVLRTGVFPFQRFAVARFEATPLLAGPLANAHLGIFLLIQFALPLAPDTARLALPGLFALAMISSMGAAVSAIRANAPRRILSLLVVSQSAGILAGFLTALPEGTTGGLLQWIVMTLASTTLFSITSSIEARISQPLSGDQLYGLASQMPRLAVLFAISALALVGLPGTLGFPGEDLLIHGVLSAHPLLGLLLPVSIALNAYSLYRLFSRIFLGAPVRSFAGAGDALPRERWALSVGLVLLVLAGLMPDGVVALRSTAADLLAGVHGQRP